MTKANSVCDESDFDYTRWLNVGRWFKVLLKRLQWWHVKIRWWVIQILRNWWLRNIDLFPYRFNLKFLNFSNFFYFLILKATFWKCYFSWNYCSCGLDFQSQTGKPYSLLTAPLFSLFTEKDLCFFYNKIEPPLFLQNFSGRADS